MPGISAQCLEATDDRTSARVVPNVDRRAAHIEHAIHRDDQSLALGGQADRL